MRSEKEVYDIVLNFAKTDKRIRMLATELFNLAVHCDTAHQRQVAVGLLAAFLHVK